MHCAGKQILYAAEGASFINYDGVWFWRKVKKFSALRAGQFFRFASVELLPRPRWRRGQPARVSTPHRRLNFFFLKFPRVTRKAGRRPLKDGNPTRTPAPPLPPLPAPRATPQSAPPPIATMIHKMKRWMRPPSTSAGAYDICACQHAAPTHRRISRGPLA